MTEQEKLIREIWENLNDYPVLDEGWCLRWLFLKFEGSDNILKIEHNVYPNYSSCCDGKSFHYLFDIRLGERKLRSCEHDLLTALLKLVLQVMKEEVK